jgi:hypothetical protein
MCLAELNIPDGDGGGSSGLHARVPRPVPHLTLRGYRGASCTGDVSPQDFIAQSPAEYLDPFPFFLREERFDGWPARCG